MPQRTSLEQHIRPARTFVQRISSKKSVANESPQRVTANLLAKTSASERSSAVFFGRAAEPPGYRAVSFWARRKRNVSNQTYRRAQKGYPAHIPRAARRPQILSPVQPKHAHIKRRQVRRSHQHSSDPAPARRKSCAPPTQKLTSQNTSLRRTISRTFIP